MNEQLEVVWNALDALAFELKLNRQGLQEMLQRNRALMLTYVDLTMQATMIAMTKQEAAQAADSATNGHQPPVSSKA
jgi:hypothetical protein